MEKKDIEIPFGAFDSELGGFEYTIPEGYEAEIKDGKVVVRKTESEDERVRKEIIRIVDIWTNSAPVVNGIPREVLLAWLEKQGEQKPAWSEEDDYNLNVVIAKVQSDIDNGRIGTNRELLTWLKSLKNKVQPKQEWSEEDDKKRKGLIKGLEDRMGFGWASDPFSREEYINWLKSLRPQNTWKPSDEQMVALESATENCAYSEYQDCLRELIGQLKKLKG